MYSDEGLIPISALNHFLYCERRCALIHLERQWAENRFTVLGELLHEKTHRQESEKRSDLIIARSLRLVSYKLGLGGQADVVEFHREEKASKGVLVPGRKGYWRPFPVEYKKGKPKQDNVDAVQLCAQAICLEEQLNVEIPEGALFYGDKRKRRSVQLDSELRTETIDLSIRLHELIASGKTPAADFTKRCRSCSLFDICNPKLVKAMKRKRYEQLLFENDE